MRALVGGVVAVVAAALLVAVPGGAGAVGTGDPVIESPLPAAKHYAGFNGPFVVNLENAPIGTYDYWVERGGNVVGSTKQHVFNGSFPKPQLRVGALPPATGYTFHITTTDADLVVHQDSLAFTVTAGSPPTCSLVLPSQIRMKARSKLVKATLSPRCTSLQTIYASWLARDRRGFFAERFTFDHTARDYWRIYDDERTGLYTVRPTGAKDVDNDDVPQNIARTTMKMDAKVSLTASRAGKTVTLRTKLTRYSPVANRYQPWAHRKVVLSYRTCASCPWKRLKTRTTDGAGKNVYRVRATGSRKYRATVSGTATVWSPHPNYAKR
ncbi:hypothetical protein ABIE44_000972 [Marmoricola sp. OAE513]|uniref:hypothetical protein n=1 Tax=Marmoricola sp. OAE513 TaxID=2817894 RepID=UPI0033942321